MEKTETTNMNIYQKMLAIVSELGYVAKNLSVKAGSESYKAVGETDVLEAIKPLEAKYGIFSYAFERKVLESEVLRKTTITEYETKKITDEKISHFMRIETTFRFVNCDNPCDFIDIKTYGDGLDNQDKAPGKAMTYSDKYALLKAYKITTGDDPDVRGSEQEGTTTIVEKPKTKQEPFTPPTLAQRKEIAELGGSLEAIAKWKGIAVEKVSAELVQQVIDKKRKDKKDAELEKEAEQVFATGGKND